MFKINIKLILLFLFPLLVSSKLLDGLLDLSILQKIVDEINGLTGGVWTAEVNAISRLPLIEQKKLCGTIIPEENRNHSQAEPPKVEGTVKGSCTTKIEFDARTKWSGCSAIIGRIQDQGQCGSCWAVSTASTYTDRYCIARAKKGQKTGTDAGSQFSALDVLSCSMSRDGCQGGWPLDAWKWIQSKGVCTGTDIKTKSGCKPYPYSSGGPTPRSPCKSACTANWGTAYQKDKHFATSAKGLQGSTATVQAIKNEIMANGPVVACFDVYNDFMSYRSGVYFKTANARKVGGHAVRIIGWGTQTCNGKSMPFWLIANSWSTGWGEKGLVKIRSGVNEVGIEKSGIAFGIPKI
uniref:Peptidase C1A papain C-terminal domain-containing protein n=1 Tax=Meloidogyne incognita TaxID=6306 RepID=A0A914MKE4_MELIC